MNILKLIPTLIVCFLLCLGGCFVLSGCSGSIIAEIAEGITEGIIDEIEESREQGHKNGCRG